MYRFHDYSVACFVIAAIRLFVGDKWKFNVTGMDSWEFYDLLLAHWKARDKIGYIKEIRNYAKGVAETYGMDLSVVANEDSLKVLEAANIGANPTTLSLRQAKDIADVVWKTCGNYGS